MAAEDKDMVDSGDVEVTVSDGEYRLVRKKHGILGGNGARCRCDAAGSSLKSQHGLATDAVATPS